MDDSNRDRFPVDSEAEDASREPHNNLAHLLNSVRDLDSRRLLREAISALQANAYRSAIVATWTAVVFDFVSKLRELELTKDRRAVETLDSYRKTQAAHDIKRSLDFEKNLVESARTDFEFLSPQEALDLNRLFEDRNRCAHPSMTAELRPYDPPAELARLHVVNAVRHLLSQPPVQSRAAREVIFHDVASEYFPTEIADAISYLSEGPLARAKETLVADVLIGLTKAYLLEEAGLSASKIARFTAAIAATAQIHPTVAKQQLARRINDIAARVEDDKLHRLIGYVATVPFAWEELNSSIRGKLAAYLEINTSPNVAIAVANAVKVDDLRATALDRAVRLDTDDLRKVLLFNPSPVFLPLLLDRFQQSGTFRGAADNARALDHFKRNLNLSDLERIADIFVENNQVTWAWGVPEALDSLLSPLPDNALSESVAWRAVLSFITNEENTEYFAKSAEDLKQTLRRLGVTSPRPENRSGAG